jgi:hypothetical protein
LNFILYRFPQQGEHLLLISLHSGLVERIDTQNVTAYSACYFKKVEQLAQIILIQFGYLNGDVRNTTFDVRLPGALFGRAVYKSQRLAGQEIQVVFIARS